jgi:hypothetical protein
MRHEGVRAVHKVHAHTSSQSHTLMRRALARSSSSRPLLVSGEQLWDAALALAPPPLLLLPFRAARVLVAAILSSDSRASCSRSVWLADAVRTFQGDEEGGGRGGWRWSVKRERDESGRGSVCVGLSFGVGYLLLDPCHKCLLPSLSGVTRTTSTSTGTGTGTSPSPGTAAAAHRATVVSVRAHAILLVLGVKKRVGVG